MHRTQIYLDDEIYTFLVKEKKKTQHSFSEIIRSKIKMNIKDNQHNILKKMEKAVGSWKEVDITPEKYISQIRKDRKL